MGFPDEQRMRWRKGSAADDRLGRRRVSKGEVANTVTAWKNLAETNPQEATKRLESMKQASGGFAGETMEQLTQQGKLPTTSRRRSTWTARRWPRASSRTTSPR